MKVTTSNFGQIEIEKEKIINFPQGLLGFPDEKQFIIINDEDEENSFQWLQSLDQPDLAFVIINPFLIYEDYDIKISKTIKDKLEIGDIKDLAIYSIVVIPQDVEKMTANLLGPLVINVNKKIGKQIILDDNRYTTKHYIFGQNENIADRSV